MLRLLFAVHDVAGDVYVRDDGNACQEKIPKVVDIGGNDMGGYIFHGKAGCLKGKRFVGHDFEHYNEAFRNEDLADCFQLGETAGGKVLILHLLFEFADVEKEVEVEDV